MSCIQYFLINVWVTKNSITQQWFVKCLSYPWMYCLRNIRFGYKRTKNSETDFYPFLCRAFITSKISLLIVDNNNLFLKKEDKFVWYYITLNQNTVKSININRLHFPPSNKNILNYYTILQWQIFFKYKVTWNFLLQNTTKVSF